MKNASTEMALNMCMQLLQAGEVERDPKKYVAKYGAEIRKAGLMLEYLNLAELDETSVLGWRPTTHFLKLSQISQDGIESQRVVNTSQDDVFIAEVFSHVVLGLKESNRGVGLGYALMEEIGLLRNVDGELEATPEFKELFYDEWFKRSIDASLGGKRRDYEIVYR